MQTVSNNAHSLRRLELEVQHLRVQLSSEQSALLECQEEREKAERLLNAICNALNDSTTASADVVATLQLSVYRYKDAYIAAHGGVSPALIELINDVEQGVERLNDSTRATQARLSNEDVQVSATEALGNGRVGAVEMDVSNISRTAAATTSTGPSPYKGYISTNGGAIIDSSFSSTTSTTTTNNGTSSEAIEIRRLKAQIVSLKRTYEEERQRLENSHKEHLSTLAVALKHDTERAEARASVAEVRVAELEEVSALLQAEVEILRKSTATPAEVAEGRRRGVESSTYDDTSSLLDAADSYNTSRIIERESTSSSSRFVDEMTTRSKVSSTSITSPRPPMSSRPSHRVTNVPLSVAGLATVEVLSQLSDAMAKLRPLSPLFSPDGIEASPRPARSRLVSPPLKSNLREIETALRLPELAGINDTLASLKVQIQDLERNTHLSMPDLGSPTLDPRNQNSFAIPLSNTTSLTPLKDSASVPSASSLLPPLPTPQSAGFQSPMPPPPSSYSSTSSSSSEISSLQLQQEQWELRSAKREREMQSEIDREAEVEASLRTQIKVDAEVEATLRSQLKTETDIEASLRDQVRSETQVVASIRTQLLEEARIEASLRTQLSLAKDELQSGADVIASLRRQLVDRVEVETSLRSFGEEADVRATKAETSLKETRNALLDLETQLFERQKELNEARMNASRAAETAYYEFELAKKTTDSVIAELQASAIDLSSKLTLAYDQVTDSRLKLEAQILETEKEKSASNIIKGELNASQEALAAAFRDMATVDANLSTALQNVSKQSNRADVAELKCSSLSEENIKLIAMIEASILEKETLTQSFELVKEELIQSKKKKETKDTSDGGIQDSGFPKDVRVGPDWNDPNEMRVASGDAPALMALAEGNGGNEKSQDRISLIPMSEGDLSVMAYDDKPALRALVDSLKRETLSMEKEVTDLRSRLEISLSTGIDAANKLAALDLSVRRYAAREEELSSQISSLRRELALAHEAVTSAENRATEAELNFEQISSKLASNQREVESSAMEARVAQEQLKLYLLRHPGGSHGSSGSSGSSGRGGGGGFENDETLLMMEQQKNEIIRLEKALDIANSRARDESERAAALSSQSLEQHRLLQSARAEASLKSADVDAHLEGLIAAEINARNEAREAKMAVEKARNEKLILETALADVCKSITSVLGVFVSIETLKLGEKSISSAISQSIHIKSDPGSTLSSLPALPPTPFSINRSGSNGNYHLPSHSSSFSIQHENINSQNRLNNSSSTLNDEDLAREMNAAATQLRLVTLQKAAMAKELTQVYKAVEVLEGSLGKTRKENSKLLATLSAVQSSRRQVEIDDDEYSNSIDSFRENNEEDNKKIRDDKVLSLSVIKNGRRNIEITNREGRGEGQGTVSSRENVEDDIVQDGAAMLAESSTNSMNDDDSYLGNLDKGRGLSRGVASALSSVFSSYSSTNHKSENDIDNITPASASSLMSPAGPFTRGQQGVFYSSGAAESARLKALSTKTLVGRR
jgi:hypothetical protein